MASVRQREAGKLTTKRQIARYIEKTSGILLIRSTDIHLLPERIHLAKFFEHFGVDCVFDVGANGGQYATRLRDSVRYNGPIISYEPITDLAERMIQRTQETQDKMWHVEPLALDREAGPATFHVAASDQFSSLRTPSVDQPTEFVQQNAVVREVTVQRSTLATELAKWQAKLGFRRPFLKMDTQGNDMAIVEGAGASLSTFVGMQTELAVRRLYEGAPDFFETLSTLRLKGFEPSAFVPNNEGHFPDMYEIDCILYNAGLKSE